MAPSSRSSGSPSVQRNFQRLAATREFRVATVSAEPSFGRGSAVPAAGAFSASGAYDKVLTLALVTLAAGIGSYLANIPAGLAVLAMFVALGLYFVTIFRPAAARYTAPGYALAEGAVLGIVSRWAAVQGFGVVALALLGTLGIYFGVLALYRSGLVRVTQTFTRVTLVVVMGTMFAALGYWLLSLFHFPILASTVGSNAGIFVIFGVMYLVSGILTLFVDFSFIENAAASGTLNRNGEWFAALSVLVSLVMVYLGLLRILGAFSGGGSSRQ